MSHFVKCIKGFSELSTMISHRIKYLWVLFRGIFRGAIIYIDIPIIIICLDTFHALNSFLKIIIISDTTLPLNDANCPHNLYLVKEIFI